MIQKIIKKVAKRHGLQEDQVWKIIQKKKTKELIK